jgi:ferrous-iron efflux pump FieF
MTPPAPAPATGAAPTAGADLERARLTRSAALASLATALLLAALKGWATWRTGSTAMLGSLADTALDLIASLATLLGVWIAAMPADEDHRFGHGKAEALAAMVQVMLIVLSGAAIAYRAVVGLIEGGRTGAAEEGIAISLVAILATLALLAWQRHVVRRTGSLAIRTDSIHYQSDLLLNLAVIAALALDQYAGLSLADPLFGLAIGLWLLWGAWRASRAAVDNLMDREWPEEQRLRFIERAARHPELSKLHDLRTRTSGNRDFAQFHVDLPAEMTVAEAHEVIERVEADLREAFPGTELLIHIDPEGHVDEPGNALVESDQFDRLEDPR